jgi:putative transposase
VSMSQPYRHTKTCVSLINYHFVWCPKRRRKVLVGRVERDLHRLLIAKAKDLGSEPIALEIMPDHVHLFLNCPPTLSPSDAMFWLKGYTSRLLRQKYPHLERMSSLWTRSYFVSTAGNVSSSTIQRYIAEQKTR